MSKKKEKSENSFLGFLYNTALGRFFLKPLKSRTVSKIAGKFLDSRLSKSLIKGFVKKNNINLDDFYSDSFRCFNDCFSRRIKEGLRPIDESPDALISPCDSLLTAYKINDDTRLTVKGVEYSVSDLLQNGELSSEFCGGVCLVFRLCVNHYHRYVYFDSGNKGENLFIKGKLHTVRPIALAAGPVFRENCREYTVMNTDNFGKAVQIEVGAMLVGKIKNHHGEHTFTRGEEKGTFLYGGSTIILLLKSDAAEVDEKFFLATERGEEIDVKMGEKIGEKIIQNA